MRRFYYRQKWFARKYCLILLLSLALLKLILSPNFIIHRKVSISKEVLLIYVYAESHAYAFENLRYFIETAVRQSDPVDYYFILQQKDNKNIDELKLPPLPENAHYIHHENICFSYGTIGWFFSKYAIGNPHLNTTSVEDSKKVDLRNYLYFIFMNSSTRGPFLPPYFGTLASLYKSISGKEYYWYSIFTNRVNDKVKLVGPVISCGILTHLQNYIVATDFVGLSILLRSDNEIGVFDCHKTFEEAIRFSEIAFTQRILARGYMIDSLMTKYQGLNFSSAENQECNQKLNPSVNNGIDGVSFDPYEIVFVKFNYKRDDGAIVEKAKIYEKWNREVQSRRAKISGLGN